MSYDIQDVLKSVQRGAPAPYTTTDDIITRARRKRARRTVGVAAAGTAACVALAVTAFSALGAAPGGGPNRGPDGGPNGGSDVGAPAASAPVGPVVTGSPLPVERVDFGTTLGDYRVGAYQVGPAGQVTAGYQEIPVYRDGDTWEDQDGTAYPYAGATITVYRPGVYDPDSFTFGEDSTLTVGPRYVTKVGSRPAFGVDMTYLSPVDKVTKYVRTALAWQYRDGAWATLIPSYDRVALPQADAVQIAAGLLTTAKKHELKVPYRLGYLPRGWQAVGVEQTAAKTSSEVSDVFLHQGPVRHPDTRVDEVLPGNVKIVVSRGKPKDTLVEGLNCFPGRHECEILRGGYLIGVGDFTGAVPDQTIRKIAAGLQFKDLSDQDTWVPVGA
jgi:hypothetical protein